MIIEIDTRERKPLVFNHPFVEEIRMTKLEAGDYGCRFKDNYQPPFFFERKSIADLFGTLSKNYERFKREINRAVELEARLCIIIEGSLTKIGKGYLHSTRDGKSIQAQLFTLMHRHHIPFVCVKDKQEMSEYIVQTFMALGREYLRTKGKRRL